MKWWCMIPLGFALSSCAGASDQELGEEVAAEVMEAFQAENFTRVLELTDGIEEASSWRQIRATAFQRRGEARFFEANIAGCIADFDAFLKMYPEQDPYHWQRGLAYYYAKEYEEGKAQFERHQDVNSQDVENAVWHFICSVRAPGGSLEEARDGFIPIQLDSRVPMKEVHALFAGEGSVDDVLNAAAADEDSVVSEQERNHLCYA
ncbi:MAG: hypothetical protein AAGC68_15835, partial [Verrucomicrobiota bacterium]